jgi:hypothetical protein
MRSKQQHKLRRRISRRHKGGKPMEHLKAQVEDALRKVKDVELVLRVVLGELLRAEDLVLRRELDELLRADELALLSISDDITRAEKEGRGFGEWLRENNPEEYRKQQEELRAAGIAL